MKKSNQDICLSVETICSKDLFTPIEDIYNKRMIARKRVFSSERRIRFYCLPVIVVKTVRYSNLENYISSNDSKSFYMTLPKEKKIESFRFIYRMISDSNLKKITCKDITLAFDTWRSLGTWIKQ